MEECTIQKLNLLAFPRSFTPICELTGEHANIELVTPHITLYYVSEAAARQAWEGIIKKIAHLLPPLRSDPPIIGTADERESRAKHILSSKKSIIDFCLSESTAWISKQRYDLAVPAATQALKLSKEVNGELSIEVVEPMLQLSQAYLGLNQLRQAEEYLALARWNILNSESCPDKVMSRMHILLGRVLTAQGNFTSAKDELAQGVYFSSRTYGAESVPTAIGYYLLGDIFLAQGVKESALAFFDKVVDIWYKFLLEAFTSSEILSLAEQGNINEEHFVDGRFQLGQILSVRENIIGENHIATGEVKYCIGLFDLLYKNDTMGALSMVKEAQKVYEKSLGVDHASTVQLESVVQAIQSRADAELSVSIGPEDESATTGEIDRKWRGSGTSQ